MKILLVLVSLAILSVILTACAPGSSVEVNTPPISIQLNTPGPNPLINQPDVVGRIASAGSGLWHGLIAPVTLLISFFDPNVQMYEVHNTGGGYSLGFLLGLGIDFFLLSFFIRMRR